MSFVEVSRPTATSVMYEAPLTAEERAQYVRAKIESRALTISYSSLDLAELLSEAREKNYHRTWGFGSFEAYVIQKNLGIGKRQAYYLANVWDGANTLTIPRDELEAAGITKLKAIFTLDIELFQNEIRQLIKDAPNLTVEEVTDAVKALKQTDESEDTWINVKVNREDKAQKYERAIETARRVAGMDTPEGEALMDVCESFLLDPNNSSTGSAERSPEDGPEILDLVEDK